MQYSPCYRNTTLMSLLRSVARKDWEAGEDLASMSSRESAGEGSVSSSLAHLVLGGESYISL